VIIWTASTGDAGSADTRARAATDATDAVLAHWAAHHPRTGADGGITICVDDAEAYVGPGITADGVYDVEATTALLNQMLDHLASTIADDHEPQLP
jgi:hypothetical protein